MHWYIVGFLVALSVVLLLLRWLYPPAWLAWLRFIQPVGEFMARLILQVFYLIFSGPFALLVRRQRPYIYKRQTRVSYWEATRAQTHTLEEVQQQF
ncbi:hypothetical protein [Candidatus Cyanaurora vandensis]|uniref:hypothetical protein n=1 Tax=Candidatus Cyanaurora vandensis TaxID=2714958 RepID=UPI002579F071|nr:hypothetical protein [Candidatus Cyanaurora vandensis]